MWCVNIGALSIPFSFFFTSFNETSKASFTINSYTTFAFIILQLLWEGRILVCRPVIRVILGCMWMSKMSTAELPR